MSAIPEPICEGLCMDPECYVETGCRGSVKLRRITDPADGSTLEAWYCDRAVEEDQSRGFGVVTVE